MLKLIESFIPIKNQVEDKYKDIVVGEVAGCSAYDPIIKDFYKKLDELNLKNKDKLNTLLNGNKLYAIVEYTNDEFPYWEYCNLINDNINVYKQYTDDNCGIFRFETKLSYLNNALRDLGTIFSMEIDDNSKLELLKNKYGYLDRIDKIRNMPKFSRLLKLLYDDIKSYFRIDYSNDKLIAKLSDMFSRKSEKYIMELSTEARDMITASVSNNYTSCFDIKRNACNCASVNYLALDNDTAILKIYKYNDDNLAKMKLGCMDFVDSVSRRYINFGIKDNNIVQFSLGRAYPDDNILNVKDMSDIIQTLISTKLNEYCIDYYLTYGKDYVGYKDFNKSGNYTRYSREYDLIKSHIGNCGCLFIDKNNVVRYSKKCNGERLRSESLFFINDPEDYDYDEDDGYDITEDFNDEEIQELNGNTNITSTIISGNSYIPSIVYIDNEVVHYSDGTTIPLTNVGIAMPTFQTTYITVDDRRDNN